MKSRVGKLIFVLSFIPYLLVLYGVCGGIIGVFTGLKELIGMFEDTYITFFVIIPIVPACLTIQMCYIFRKKRKIMFICSFIPCIFAVLIAINKAVSGVLYPMTGAMYYGLEAFDIALFRVLEVYTGFLILPICLIFQIVLIILSIIKKQKAKKAIQKT